MTNIRNIRPIIPISQIFFYSLIFENRNNRPNIHYFPNILQMPNIQYHSVKKRIFGNTEYFPNIQYHPNIRPIIPIFKI